MKKSLFLLSLITLAVAGCSNNNGGAEVASANADVVDASTAWQTEVQSAPMPSSMSQPTYQPPKPTYQAPAATPTYSAPQSYGNSETVGACNVVRDADNKPIYAQIQKGCYTDSQYTVGAQDTLYLIGYLTGTNANQIAAMNNLNPSAKLPVGKVLRVR